MQTSTEILADRSAEFVALLGEHRRLIYRVATSYARGRADIDDLAQEIAAQAWRSFPSFDPTRRFSTWLYRLALNVAISWMRVEGPRRRQSVSYEASLHEPATDADMGSDDGLRILRAFIDAQSALDRAVLLLYLDERPLAEMADILGITTTNLTTKISRLKQRLAEHAERLHGTR